MRRRFTQRGDGTGAVAEISVTSLVDVAFTLLIIFMITAPILQGGIEIDVPEAASGPLSASDALVVSIDAGGQIYLDDVPVTYEEFSAAIEAALERFDSDNVFIKADGDIALRLALRVMGRIDEAGGIVSIVTEPEPRRRP
ncbi:ExbD/TolR family protein [Candidatus Palauibacter sp.]|uniref:ExbD/TolR family protein n=1 Tax=Candidatus Palauibacter sp. TaxID=3101350 RepID=UPI003AF289F9